MISDEVLQKLLLFDPKSCSLHVLPGFSADHERYRALFHGTESPPV